MGFCHSWHSCLSILVNWGILLWLYTWVRSNEQASDFQSSLIEESFCDFDKLRNCWYSLSGLSILVNWGILLWLAMNGYGNEAENITLSILVNWGILLWLVMPHTCCMGFTNFQSSLIEESFCDSFAKDLMPFKLSDLSILVNWGILLWLNAVRMFVPIASIVFQSSLIEESFCDVDLYPGESTLIWDFQSSLIEESFCDSIRTLMIRLIWNAFNPR